MSKPFGHVCEGPLSSSYSWHTLFITVKRFESLKPPQKAMTLDIVKAHFWWSVWLKILLQKKVNSSDNTILKIQNIGVELFDAIRIFKIKIFTLMVVLFR